MPEYRYSLEKYKGLSTRYTCPGCGSKRSLTRYVDNTTGEHIADNVGKCDREVNCGYHYTPKKYFADPSTFKPLVVGHGSCVASDRITVDGLKVGIMYREKPQTKIDSGWNFLAGDESAKYVSAAKNFEVYDINTIANLDPAITFHL